MKANFYAKLEVALRAAGADWPGGATNMAIRRTHAGRLQKENGAWTWFLVQADGSLTPGRGVGSSYPARELDRHPVLTALVPRTPGLGIEIDFAPWIPGP